MIVIDLLLVIPFILTQDCADKLKPGSLAVIVLIIAYKVFLILAGVVIAFRSRAISIQRFNERQQLGFSIKYLFICLFFC